MPFPFSHPASPLTSVKGVTNLLQPEKHRQMVKVCFPPCVVIDPQELGGALPNGALRGEKNSESGFSALVFPNMTPGVLLFGSGFRAFQCPARTPSLIHTPYSAHFSSWLASSHPGNTLRYVGVYTVGHIVCVVNGLFLVGYLYIKSDQEGQNIAEFLNIH